jgi:hypothetical protein
VRTKENRNKNKNWKVKVAEKVKAKIKDLKRSKVKAEIKRFAKIKDLKRFKVKVGLKRFKNIGSKKRKQKKERQWTKSKKFPAQKDSIFIPLAFAFFILISFVNFIVTFAFSIFHDHLTCHFIYFFQRIAS